jgi:ankyrin repeat protein
MTDTVVAPKRPEAEAEASEPSNRLPSTEDNAARSGTGNKQTIDDSNQVQVSQKPPGALPLTDTEGTNDSTSVATAKSRQEGRHQALEAKPTMGEAESTPNIDSEAKGRQKSTTEGVTATKETLEVPQAISQAPTNELKPHTIANELLPRADGGTKELESTTSELLSNRNSTNTADELFDQEELNWRLMMAAGGGRVQDIKTTLVAGAQILAPDRCGATALHRAAMCNRTESVKVILEEYKEGNIDISNYINDKDVNGWRPLYGAAAKADADLVSMILEIDGVDPRMPDRYGVTPLYRAGRILQHPLGPETIEIVAPGDNWTPLHAACFDGDANTVRVLAYSAKLDSRDVDEQTPLHVAIFAKKDQVVPILLSKAKALNQSLVDLVDSNMQTALHLASRSGHSTVVQALIKAGRASMSSTVTNALHCSWQGEERKKGTKRQLKCFPTHSTLR